MIRALGMNPEQLLTRDALAEGATTHKDQADIENHQLTILSRQLKDLIPKMRRYKGVTGMAPPKGLEPLTY